MKRHLAGIHYYTDNDVISSVDDFRDLPNKTSHENRVMAREQRWKGVWTLLLLPHENLLKSDESAFNCTCDNIEQGVKQIKLQVGIYL